MYQRKNPIMPLHIIPDWKQCLELFHDTSTHTAKGIVKYIFNHLFSIAIGTKNRNPAVKQPYERKQNLQNARGVFAKNSSH